MKIARLIFVLFVSIFTTKVESGIPSPPLHPTPPLIPGGFADAQGKTGFFANPGGGIDAVDLATGQGRWISKRGRWPLFSSHGWLAVIASPETEHKNALRLRFLNPSDGSLLSETAPIGEIAIGMEAATDEVGFFWGDRNGSFSLSASLLPQGRLLLRSVANHMLITGMMPPQQTRKPDTGMFYINPVDGKVEKAPVSAVPPFGPAVPKLPPGWKKDGHSSYSGRGSWGDKPSPFRISEGVAGYFSCDYSAKRVILNRWRSGEPLFSISIMEGTEHVPILALDGRYAVLTSYENGTNRAHLFDLMKPDGPLAELLFPKGFNFSFAVIGTLLYYVTETRMQDGAEKTQINRALVALDWEKGKVRWTHSLAPRFEFPPVPGAGR